MGAENVYLPNQTHVQSATSPESFAAQYEFLNGAPPATTSILPEARVQLSGRAVIFPQNLGVDDATLEIFEVDGATGARLHPPPTPPTRSRARSARSGRSTRSAAGTTSSSSCATTPARTTSTPSRSYAVTS